VIRTTPFHPRLSELNTQGLYTHWQGYLSALRYSHAPKHEYFAVRGAVGVFDTSPLFKYRVYGPDAERFLAGVLVRDIRSARPGRAQYTCWVDDRGFVMEDGVVLRHADDDFLLTTARPSLGWFADLAGRLRVAFEDVTDGYAVLAVQGPRSRAALAGLTDVVDQLTYLGHAPTKIASAPVTVSRTGYTGDLGFEVWADATDALPVLDAVLDAGRGHGLRPYGEEAMGMLRIEAGLALVDVEFHNSRLAETDHQRVTPNELGLGWMLRGVLDDDRAFVGREAIRRELRENRSRWATVGIVVDWQDWDRVHLEAGLLPPKDPMPLPYESVLYLDDGDRPGVQAGYVTSFAYSPVLQRHIGLARVAPTLAPQGAQPGSAVRMELAINHHNTTVAARTAALPLFNPARKTARP
jgi:aminomethyltransferase